MIKQNLSYIFRILSPDQSRSGLKLILFMFAGMLLETLGVGAIIPLIALIGSKNIAENYPALLPLMNFLGNPSHELLCLYAVTGLVIIYLFKQLFLAFSIKSETSYAFSLQENLSKRLFTIYMNQPYTFHLQKNSAQLIQNILSEVNVLVFKVIWPIMRIVSEVFLLGFISLLLFMVEPVGAICVAGFLITIGLIFHKTTKNRIGLWGKQRALHEEKVVQHLQQGLGGIKDATVLGRINHFIHHFSIHNSSRVSIGRSETVSQQYPRLFIEFFSIVGLAMIVWVMIYQGKPIGTIVPTLGVFAAAAFRLMPSANRLITSIQSVKFGAPVVPRIYNEFQLGVSKLSEHGLINSVQHIAIRDVHFSYAGTTNPALKGVTIDIQAGDSIGLVGESGSGKSTLVDCILGLLVPSKGCIEINGSNIHSQLRSWQNQIGYVSQAIFLSDDSLRRNIAYGLPDDQIDEEKVRRALKLSQLDNYVTDLPDGLDTLVGERGVRLSGGQRQRIGIARALYHDPRILVLDEATSALDIATEREVMKGVFDLNKDKTLIIIAHRLSTVAGCKRIYHMSKGLIIEEGRPEDVLSKINLTSNHT